MANWVGKLIEAFRRWRRRRQERRLHFWPIPEAEIYDFADKAYDQCVKLVGVPADAQLPYKICRSATWPYCAKGFRGYEIRLSSTSSTTRLKLVVAHEMYHRVTSVRTRQGVHRLYWVREMMAETAALRVIRRELSRHESYEYEARHFYNRSALPLSELKRCWPRPFASRYGLWKHPYPKGFYSGVARVGQALIVSVGMKRLCSLANARSLAAWVGSLPPYLRYSAADLLELQNHGYERPTSVGLLCRHAGALIHLDRFDDARILLRELHQMHPQNCRVLQLLMRFSIRNAAYQTAVDYGLDCLRARPGEVRYMHNLISAYGYLDDDLSAMKWLNEIVRLRPQDPWGHQYTGILLIRMGRFTEAVEALKIVVNLDDNYYTPHAKVLIKKHQQELSVVNDSLSTG